MPKAFNIKKPSKGTTTPYSKPVSKPAKPTLIINTRNPGPHSYQDGFTRPPMVSEFTLPDNPIRLTGLPRVPEVPEPTISRLDNMTKIRFINDLIPDHGMWLPKPGLKYRGGCPGCGAASMCFGPTHCQRKCVNRLGQTVPHPATYMDKSTWTACPYTDKDRAELGSRRHTPTYLPWGEPWNRPGANMCGCCCLPIDPHNHGRKSKYWRSECRTTSERNARIEKRKRGKGKKE